MLLKNNKERRFKDYDSWELYTDKINFPDVPDNYRYSLCPLCGSDIYNNDRHVFKQNKNRSDISGLGECRWWHLDCLNSVIEKFGHKNPFKEFKDEIKFINRFNGLPFNYTYRQCGEILSDYFGKKEDGTDRVPVDWAIKILNGHTDDYVYDICPICTKEVLKDHKIFVHYGKLNSWCHTSCFTKFAYSGGS